MEYLLQCENLVKKYGRKRALNNLNLEIKKGKIVGLLGPNGAGKTTLIKTAASLLSYDRGNILIDGRSPSEKTKKIVAYLPDKDFLYEWMTIKEALKFFKNFFEDFDYEKSLKMVEELELDLNSKINSLSKGMQEKLNISLIFSRKAKLFLFDEPLAAVDPSMREKIIKIILNNFDKDSSILISTHLINDVEGLFDEVVFINEGKVLLHDNVEAIKQKHKKSIEDLFKEMI
ncbi:ABC transporter ATP-binding protein [Clostridium aciditolerans]|uniref:ABC transporter ATP-binding protein n=1 Tax=Clostridium aciditolerans TaxID=339861 RepID=A0A934M9C4_9CLOT|nr:ABC transporter ATP-binding protein [Clostridium aciditolerans]MBI6875656.1 ABC transporter ATP-binding protein [Clostridium aciditolerans]